MMMALSFVAVLASCDKEELVEQNIESDNSAEKNLTVAQERSGDCSKFNGLKFFTNGKAVHAKGANSLISDRKTIVWSVDGVDVLSNSKISSVVFPFLRFISEPGTHEVCFTAETESCGMISDCVKVTI